MSADGYDRDDGSGGWTAVEGEVRKIVALLRPDAMMQLDADHALLGLENSGVGDASRAELIARFLAETATAIRLLQVQRDQALNGLRWVIDVEDGKIEATKSNMKARVLSILESIAAS
jgi:hypothetical protein